MDEPDVHAQLDLFDRLALHQVGADPPVLLGRIDDVVVDPARPGCLEQRVIEEEAETAAWLGDPGDLRDRRVDGVDVLEHEARDRGVEGCVGRNGRPSAVDLR